MIDSLPTADGGMRYIGRAFTWVAVYHDGTTATEADFGSLSQVPRKNDIAYLAGAPITDPGNEARWHIVDMPENVTPVIRWGRSIEANGNGDGTGRYWGRLMLGWQEGDYITLLVIHDDGTTHIERIGAD